MFGRCDYWGTASQGLRGDRGRGTGRAGKSNGSISLIIEF